MPRSPIQTEIQGRWWTVIFRRLAGRRKDGSIGDCDPEKHVITLCTSLGDEPGEAGRTLREIAIHEFLHAQQWALDELAIVAMAEDLDAYLTDLEL